ncbi:helix-turn-helix domain-containing protein [Sphaerisporangium fuscum]|uniref:helix-turn-helix domain-containing protein n=1 Tax=Sphaerisporangium fuscum TaxID=2835868 RepID=UPI001BDBCEB8|nr:helix-turn-helix domain-containing protein [Sphaerisporangium fuscum]
MRELAGRLAAFDAAAADAVQVIAYFDRLIEGRAGLEALVRGAAVLSGCPARLVDDERRLRVRVEPDGRRRDDAGPADDSWLRLPLAPGGPSAVWLERAGPAGAVDAMVLERLAAAVRVVLDRTRGGSPAPDDPALVETVLDASAHALVRLAAARRLGLTAPLARAVALPGGVARLEPVPGPGARPRQENDGRAGAGPAARDGRAGVGPVVPLLELPASWAAARTALRFTADGGEQDPGPRVVYADELGGLAVLAAAVGPGTAPVPDVEALERAGAAARWMLTTLDAVASCSSLRAAAVALHVHHSTLQERLAQAEHLLGWPVREPRGRLRLQLALALRRLHRQPG